MAFQDWSIRPHSRSLPGSLRSRTSGVRLQKLEKGVLILDKPEFYIVAHDRVIVRSAPSTKANAVGFRRKGDRVLIRARNSTWLQLDETERDSLQFSTLNVGNDAWMLLLGDEAGLPGVQLLVPFESTRYLALQAQELAVRVAKTQERVRKQVESWQMTAPIEEDEYCVYFPFYGIEARRHSVFTADRDMWSVYAARDFAEGEIVEEIESIFAISALAVLRNASLKSYTFNAPRYATNKITPVTYEMKNARALPLGFALLYRMVRGTLPGAEESNVSLQNGTNSCGITGSLVLVASKAVECGDELTLPPKAFECTDAQLERLPRSDIWKLPERSFGVTAGSVVCKPSEIHGRGVFALRDFKMGDIIEICPCLEIEEDTYNTFDDFCMSFPTWDDYGEESGCMYVLPLGYGMLYNHSETDFHAEWGFSFCARVVQLTAIRPIAEGEEIFIYYGEDYFSTRNMTDKTIK